MYSEILRTPGVLAVYVTSVIGRLPLGALGLVLILRTREMTGSYAAGGAVAAASAVAMGVGSPLLGRLVDRHGQALVVTLGGLWSAALLGAFAALPDGTPVWTAAAIAAVGGATLPPLSACQRAIWTDTLAPRLRHGAYALDAVVFEMVYIAGPLVVVGGVGAWSLRAAVAACAVLGGLGALAFAATRLSRDWKPHPKRSTDRWGPLRSPGVRTIVFALGLFAVGVAGVEIGVAAFAQRQGSTHSVGLLLALWGAGSMVGGLVAGRLAPPADPARRLAVLLLALALLQVPLVLAGSLVAMGAAITVAGFAIAPAMALSFSLLSEVAPAGTVTEAQTWVTTAFGVGVAGGSALGGWVVDHAGTRAALGGVVVVGLLAALQVAARRRTLAHGPDEATGSEAVAA